MKRRVRIGPPQFETVIHPIPHEPHMKQPRPSRDFITFSPWWLCGLGCFRRRRIGHDEITQLSRFMVHLHHALEMAVKWWWWNHRQKSLEDCAIFTPSNNEWLQIWKSDQPSEAVRRAVRRGFPPFLLKWLTNESFRCHPSFVSQLGILSPIPHFQKLTNWPSLVISLIILNLLSPDFPHFFTSAPARRRAKKRRRKPRSPRKPSGPRCDPQSSPKR